MKKAKSIIWLDSVVRFKYLDTNTLYYSHMENSTKAANEIVQ